MTWSFHKDHYAQFQVIMWLAFHEILETRNGDVFCPCIAHKSWCLLLYHSQVQLLATLLLTSANFLVQDDQNVDVFHITTQACCCCLGCTLSFNTVQIVHVPNFWTCNYYSLIFIQKSTCEWLSCSNSSRHSRLWDSLGIYSVSYNLHLCCFLLDTHKFNSTDPIPNVSTECPSPRLISSATSNFVKLMNLFTSWHIWQSMSSFCYSLIIHGIQIVQQCGHFLND